MNAITVPATTVDDVAQIKGFLVPYYTETDPATGEQKYGLLPAEFRMVQGGVACPKCLADFGGLYRPVCPACRYSRDVDADFFSEPDYWKPDPNDPDRRAS